MLRENKKIIFFCALIFFLIFGIYNSIFFYDFYIIDDHKLANLLGPDRYFSLEDFKLYVSDAYDEFKSFKYRFFLLQKIFIGIELLIFQDNLNFFYFNRFIIVCIFFIILFIYSSKLIGQYLSLILCLEQQQQGDNFIKNHHI